MDLSDAFARFVVILILALLFIEAIFVFAILGTLMGAFVGWVISITPLGAWVEEGFSVFGFNAKGFLPHVGAMLGFVSGFIRGIVEVKRTEKD